MLGEGQPASMHSPPPPSRITLPVLGDLDLAMGSKTSHPDPTLPLGNPVCKTGKYFPFVIEQCQSRWTGDRRATHTTEWVGRAMPTALESRPHMEGARVGSL